MKKSDLDIHAKILERAIERVKATPEPNPVLVGALQMLQQEYQGAHEIFPMDPE